ncbi:ABC transporter permease [Streptomyces sp. DSM 42041]|uniref:ABC transporter permease n=1 Tax=Streptomyces hazeniae TaxID=3075538 RepID=A0ABU2NW34_9ACTN|nr:ABC transporter permease [Streptomyces sp. DSM 42041]MDT0380722.1 ABC transporter permease [Streptomyces sp. DSM 42041]
MSLLPAALRPGGLTWTVLTTHRAVLRIWLGCLVLGAAALVALHFYGAHVVEASDACSAGDLGCDYDVGKQIETYRFTLALVQGLLAFLPLAVAGFAGAALVGREMDNGTAALAWTQSVTPVRWLVGKLTLPALLLVAGTIPLTLLVRWADDRDFAPEWHGVNPYLATGPTGTAYLLLALVVGAVAGLLLRRTLPALAAGVGFTGAAMILGAVFRFDLWPKVFVSGNHTGLANNAYIAETGGVTASGERFSFDRCFRVPQPEFDVRSCLEKYDADHYVLFHPSSHYWPLQLVETGIVLALAAALVTAAFWLLRRRLP